MSIRHPRRLGVYSTVYRLLKAPVCLAPEHSLDGGFGYQAEFTAVLMAALETNDIDVVILNRASPLLYHRVLAQGIGILTRDLPATTTREGRALSRYRDYVPQLAKPDAGRRAAITP